MPVNQESSHAGPSRKCGHEGCKCAVKPGQRYCSDYCDSTAKSNRPASAKCGCGHSACATQR